MPGFEVPRVQAAVRECQEYVTGAKSKHLVRTDTRGVDQTISDQFLDLRFPVRLCRFEGIEDELAPATGGRLVPETPSHQNAVLYADGKIVNGNRFTSQLLIVR